jgi:hypothetical protein
VEHSSITGQVVEIGCDGVSIPTEGTVVGALITDQGLVGYASATSDLFVRADYFVSMGWVADSGDGIPGLDTYYLPAPTDPNLPGSASTSTRTRYAVWAENAMSARLGGNFERPGLAALLERLAPTLGSGGMSLAGDVPIRLDRSQPETILKLVPELGLLHIIQIDNLDPGMRSRLGSGATTPGGTLYRTSDSPTETSFYFVSASAFCAIQPGDADRREVAALLTGLRVEWK